MTKNSMSVASAETVQSNKPQAGARTGKKTASKRGWGLALALLLAAAGASALLAAARSSKDAPGSRGATYTTGRQNLLVTVQEGGQVVARVNLEIKSEVSGTTQIIRMIPEGSYVTEQDVQDKKVLVVLDSQKLVDRLVEEEIHLETARAAFSDAREAYEIQKNQNDSDINKAMLKVEFARMDLEKYLGAQLARKLLNEHAAALAAQQAELEKQREQAVNEQPGANDPAEVAQAVQDGTETAPEGRQGTMNTDRVAARMFENHVAGRAYDLLKVSALDLGSYAEEKVLGGEALQRRRELTNDIKLKQAQLAQAREDYEATKQLFDRRFAPKLELEKAELTKQQREVDVEKADTALRLFLVYDFSKQATKLFSDYLESLEEMRRVEASARSSLFQKHVRLMRERNNLRRNEDRVKHTREQIENSVIRATQPGLVVYATTGSWRNPEPVEEGTTVRERQSIITIPDPSTMAIDIKIPESKVRQLRQGMPAMVTVDSMPGRPFKGRVHRIAILPEPSRWGMDVKVYKTIVSIDPDDPRTSRLKPGMAGSAEIYVQELADVLAVPIQAVHTVGERRFVCLDQGDDYLLSEVEVGASNDAFVEILSGLADGDRVRLDPPTTLRERLKKYETSSKDAKAPEGIELKDPSEYPKPGEGQENNKERDRPGRPRRSGRVSPGD